MTKQKSAAIVIVLLLAASNLVFISKYLEARKESEQLISQLAEADAKLPVREFNRLFIDKVLRVEGEVSFDTRLELENKVRDLGDAQMLQQWNSFVNASDEAQAQTEVKNLLGLLAQRMNE